MEDWTKPRSYPTAQMTRDTEPYAHQRDRQIFNKQPRPAQANTSQPNQKITRSGWGLSTPAYWQGVFEDYMRRKNNG